MKSVAVIAQQASPLGALLPLIFFGLMFWVLIYNPQRKRARRQRELLAAIGTEDRVVTIGGLHGTVMQVDEDTVRLEVAPGTVVTMAKGAIARRLVDADAGDDGGSVA